MKTKLINGARAAVDPKAPGYVFPYDLAAQLVSMTVTVAGVELYVLWGSSKDDGAGVWAVESSGYWLWAIDALSTPLLDALQSAASAQVAA
jgi:hypothetical protein